MNTLIIGSLFALALLALVALAFVIRSEPRRAKTRTVKVEGEPARAAQAKEAAEIAAIGVPAQPNLSASREEMSLEEVEVSRFPLTNGSFHKLSTELHALHGQAQEIEHRLSILTEMVERIENNQNTYTSIEEEAGYTHTAEQVSVN